jgi:hypothetical protein
VFRIAHGVVGGQQVIQEGDLFGDFLHLVPKTRLDFGLIALQLRFVDGFSIVDFVQRDRFGALQSLRTSALIERPVFAFRLSADTLQRAFRAFQGSEQAHRARAALLHCDILGQPQHDVSP